MGRTGKRITAIWATACLLVACSEQADVGQFDQATAQAETHDVSGLAIVPVSIDANGTRHVFRAELADTPEAQARGLMYRTKLGPDEAMLFPSEAPTARAFWMKNTPIPLDIIFIGLDGRITNIAAMTEPYSEEQVYSVGSASAVLELAGGRAAELDIEPGDKVTWTSAR